MASRRSFMAAILAAGRAPAFVGATVLMPVRSLVMPASLVSLTAWNNEFYRGIHAPRSCFDSDYLVVQASRDFPLDQRNVLNTRI